MRRFLALALTVGVAVPGLALAAGTQTKVKSQIAQIERTTEQIRGLAPTHAVKTVLLGNSAFDRAWGVNLRQSEPDAEVELNRRESLELGFLSKKDNLRHLLFHQSAAYILGFYDYIHKVLYVRNSASALFGAGRHTIAHEYTHALQDQHYGLQKLLPDQFPLAYRNSDVVGARHALTEGDAVVTEELYIRRSYSRQDLQALAKLESAPSHDPPLPKALKHQLYFPYTTGVDFVTRLYRKNGIAGIDAAYRRLPVSTYEIMHPTAYLAGWKPVAVSLHGVTGFSDWQQVDDDVFGAFGYDLLIWQFGSKRVADRVTTDYRGDRYIFLEKGADNALLMDSVWSGAAAARTAEAILFASFKGRFRHPHVSRGAEPVIHTPSLAIYLRRRRASLTIAIAPTPALARQLAAAPTN